MIFLKYLFIIFIQLGWGWSGSGPGDSKMPPDPAIGMPPMIDGYTVPPDSAAPMPG